MIPNFTENSLQRILTPQSIAIVGASNDSNKRGNLAIRYLLDNGYAGDIYPVHPREQTVLGLACYASIEQLPSAPDLALVCTGAQTLPDIIRQCGERGILGAVVLATGFSETGTEGAVLESAMLTAARETGVRLIGPNTSGMFNAHCQANLVGYRDLRAGSIGLLSQSGNMALSLVTEASHNERIGFSTYIGVGNEADIQFHEYLRYFQHDSATQVVVGYIEGLKNGQAFLETAAQVCAEKPIVVYKSGRTHIGRATAQSHTGALAGSYTLAENVMHQAGITLVDRADEILPTAETLSSITPLLPIKSHNVAILADGGGHAGIAADSLDIAGLNMPKLTANSQKALQDILPVGAAVRNPVDVAGGTDSDPYVFVQCAEILLKDPNIDALLIVGLFGGYALRFNEALLERELLSAAELPKLSHAMGKPIFLQSLYTPMATTPLIALKEAKIPVFESIDTATRCLAYAVKYSEAQRRLKNARLTTDSSMAIASSTQDMIAHALSEQRHCLYEHEALNALASYQANITSPIVVQDRDALVSFVEQQAADNTDQAWVMKIVSQDILHKTDAGGVLLNVTTTELTEAYDQLLANARHYKADADIHGVLIAPMADTKTGVEVIIGVANDQQFGPVMMFGLGGIFVEVLKDVVFRSLPIQADDARAMLMEIAAKDILQGSRGHAAIDHEALIQLMMSVSNLYCNHSEIEELDLNPVLAREQGYTVLDARIILKPTGSLTCPETLSQTSSNKKESVV